MVDKKKRAKRALRPAGERVRTFILHEVVRHPDDIARRVARHFGISRQAANRHLQNLIAEGALRASGATRARRYALPEPEVWQRRYPITESLAEDVVWRTDVRPALGNLPANVLGLWEHGFTELFNNAIDHSEGGSIRVVLTHAAEHTEMQIDDDGVGIFRKIRDRLGLLDERHAVLELAKGKLTTDPARHTGEGIFFSSRMFDAFEILSGGAYFSHERRDDTAWILEVPQNVRGTLVRMRLSNHTARRTRDVFDQFAPGEEFAFTKTIVPVRLARYGDEQLVSRSQAKRLLMRVDRFRTVLLDFADVTSIGPAFADEVFRVFVAAHPEVEIASINASTAVQQMITRATATGQAAKSNEPP